MRKQVLNETYVTALGHASTTIEKLLTDTIYSEFGHPKPVGDNRPSMFTRCYIFDRSIDYASILTTSFTYESLIHETFGIDCATVDFTDQVRALLVRSTHLIWHRLCTS